MASGARSSVPTILFHTLPHIAYASTIRRPCASAIALCSSASAWRAGPEYFGVLVTHRPFELDHS